MGTSPEAGAESPGAEPSTAHLVGARAGQGLTTAGMTSASMGTSPEAAAPRPPRQPQRPVHRGSPTNAIPQHRPPPNPQVRPPTPRPGNARISSRSNPRGAAVATFSGRAQSLRRAQAWREMGGRSGRRWEGGEGSRGRWSAGRLTGGLPHDQLPEEAAGDGRGVGELGEIGRAHV